MAPTDVRPGDLVYFEGHVGFVEDYNPITKVGKFYSMTGQDNDGTVHSRAFTTDPRNTAKTPDGQNISYWGLEGGKEFTTFARPREEYYNSRLDQHADGANPDAPVMTLPDIPVPRLMPPLPSHSSAVDAPNVYTDSEGNTHLSYTVGSGANGSGVNPGDLIDFVTDANGYTVSWTRTYATGDTVVREEYSNGTVTTTIRDAEDGTLLSQEVTATDPYYDQFRQAFDDQAARDAAGRPSNGEQVASNDYAGNQTDAATDAAVADSSWLTDPANQATAGGLLSALSFMQSLQADNELGAITSAVSMVNAFAKANHLSAFGTEQGFNAPVNVGIVSALGVVGAYRGLDQALEEGDTFGAVVQGANLVYQGAQLYSWLSNSGSTVASGASALGEGAAAGAEGALSSTGSSALGTAGQVVGVLGLAYSLSQGDAWGAFVSIVTYVCPVVGIILMFAGMIFGIGEEDPPPAPRIWGEGALIWDEAGNLKVETRAGDHTNHSAYDDYRAEFEASGKAPIEGALGAIKAQLEAYTQANPEMGVIPTRLPILHYEQTTNELSLATIDAETGEPIVRRFDATTGFPRDRVEGPEALETLFDVYIKLAEQNLAIAPQFEVEAAKAKYHEALSRPQPTYTEAGGRETYEDDSGTRRIDRPDSIRATRFLPELGDATDHRAAEQLADGSLFSRLRVANDDAETLPQNAESLQQQRPRLPLAA